MGRPADILRLCVCEDLLKILSHFEDLGRSLLVIAVMALASGGGFEMGGIWPGDISGCWLQAQELVFWIEIRFNARFRRNQFVCPRVIGAGQCTWMDDHRVPTVTRPSIKRRCSGLRFLHQSIARRGRSMVKDAMAGSSIGQGYGRAQEKKRHLMLNANESLMRFLNCSSYGCSTSRQTLPSTTLKVGGIRKQAARLGPRRFALETSRMKVLLHLLKLMLARAQVVFSLLIQFVNPGYKK